MGCNLSKEMMLLLKKIERPKRFKPASDIPLTPSPELMTLLGRIETKRWVERSLQELEFIIAELDDELGFNEHIPKCEQCRMEMCLSVERYLGTRGPWWINSGSGDLSEIYSDCPKADVMGMVDELAGVSIFLG